MRKCLLLGFSSGKIVDGTKGVEVGVVVIMVPMREEGYVRY